MIVSPMVAGIWIGGLIAVFGALTALWPGSETRRRTVRSIYAAKLAASSREPEVRRELPAATRLDDDPSRLTSMRSTHYIGR